MRTSTRVLASLFSLLHQLLLLLLLLLSLLLTAYTPLVSSPRFADAKAVPSPSRPEWMLSRLFRHCQPQHPVLERSPRAECSNRSALEPRRSFCDHVLALLLKADRLLLFLMSPFPLPALPPLPPSPPSPAPSLPGACSTSPYNAPPPALPAPLAPSLLPRSAPSARHLSPDVSRSRMAPLGHVLRLPYFAPFLTTLQCLQSAHIAVLQRRCPPATRSRALRPPVAFRKLFRPIHCRLSSTTPAFLLPSLARPRPVDPPHRLAQSTPVFPLCARQRAAAMGF